ncbi:MAG: rRNA maturation RNase YbeY, partial [Verrucomicrobiales bacterium]
LPKVIGRQRPESVLSSLTEVEITLIDDATIAHLHALFMDLPEPTDVITFHHGEVLISIETAERQAADYGRSLRDEVALYIIHGLLHLAGYLDKTPEDFECMAATQESILRDCLAEK